MAILTQFGSKSFKKKTKNKSENIQCFKNKNWVQNRATAFQFTPEISLAMFLESTLEIFLKNCYWP